jgi:flagellar protein FlaG
MTDIQSLQSSQAGKAAQHPSVPAAQTAPSLPAKPVVATPERPVIQAPKPNDIKYNPKEVLKRLEEAVSMLNAQVNANNLNVSFSMDKSFALPVVTMRDKDSGEIVRQFPNETAIALAHQFDSLKGVLHSSKV